MYADDTSIYALRADVDTIQYNIQYNTILLFESVFIKQYIVHNTSHKANFTDHQSIRQA